MIELSWLVPRTLAFAVGTTMDWATRLAPRTMEANRIRLRIMGDSDCKVDVAAGMIVPGSVQRPAVKPAGTGRGIVAMRRIRDLLPAHGQEFREWARRVQCLPDARTTAGNAPAAGAIH